METEKYGYGETDTHTHRERERERDTCTLKSCPMGSTPPSCNQSERKRKQEKNKTKKRTFLKNIYILLTLDNMYGNMLSSYNSP